MRDVQKRHAEGTDGQHSTQRRGTVARCAGGSLSVCWLSFGVLAPTEVVARMVGRDNEVIIVRQLDPDIVTLRRARRLNTHKEAEESSVPVGPMVARRAQPQRNVEVLVLRLQFHLCVTGGTQTVSVEKGHQR